MSIIDKLRPEELKQLNRIIRGKVNFLSGTVAPAKSDKETMDIESLEHAIEHYRKRGVTQLIVQPKYMGSRGTLYLFKDIEKSYMVSRNGFVIKKVDLKEVIQDAWDKVFGEDSVFDHASMVMIDGELMPWRALGGGLIDNSFGKFGTAVRNELQELKQFGFEEALRALNDSIPQTDHEKRNKKKYDEYMPEYIPTEDQEEYLTLFDRQMELFGGEAPTEFKPFNILKVVCENGEEKIVQDRNGMNSSILEVIGFDLDFLRLNILEEGYEIKLQEFMKGIEEKELEGVVVKPYQYSVEFQTAPMLKVRNGDYLRIVYGFDYTDKTKLARLVEKKAIGKKVGASIKEYTIGNELLKIPYSKLGRSNHELEETVARALLSFSKTAELDPRL